jgi:hypothetical protein
MRVLLYPNRFFIMLWDSDDETVMETTDDWWMPDMVSLCFFSSQGFACDRIDR